MTPAAYQLGLHAFRLRRGRRVRGFAQRRADQRAVARMVKKFAAVQDTGYGFTKLLLNPAYEDARGSVVAARSTISVDASGNITGFAAAETAARKSLLSDLPPAGSPTDEGHAARSSGSLRTEFGVAGSCGDLK